MDQHSDQRRTIKPALSDKEFNYHLNYDSIDFNESPEYYRVGKGEQGVLLVEPYKSELLPYWRFRTPVDAKKSAQALMRCFLKYKSEEDFIGMDMARKFIQMGFTRSRRYANRKSGRKYADDGTLLPLDIDNEKAESAAIFYEYWKKLEADEIYADLKTAWKATYG